MESPILRKAVSPTSRNEQDSSVQQVIHIQTDGHTRNPLKSSLLERRYTSGVVTDKNSIGTAKEYSVEEKTQVNIFRDSLVREKESEASP